ncbi:MAG: hypothetical protein LW875_11305 [Proteobacteria bacterium]|jgi:ribosome-associated translation inhibitor RaiA|nr:hypothetical protein [Pseudomonadota bacterium]
MNIKVVFQNLKKSEALEQVVTQKLIHTIEKFPRYGKASASVYVSMDNSPRHAGADVFSIKLVMTARHESPVVLKKLGGNPYEALAILNDRLQDVLNQNGDRLRQSLRQDQRARRRLEKWGGPDRTAA